MAVIVQDGRLTLTGYVGEHWVYEDEVMIDGFTHPMVIDALAEVGDDTDLTVHINSGGGYAVEGVAIHSVLAQRSGRTDVVIDGMAASSASLIAMVGETIRMASGSQMMIHDPSGMTVGTVADHEASIRGLDSLATSFARVYARRSGMTAEAAREIMKAETWYGDDEAVAAGFADKTDDDKATAFAAFPYQTYAHAPQKLVALARENGWRQPAVRPAATAATKAAPPAVENSQAKDNTVTDTTKAGDKPADNAAAIADASKAAATAAVTADRDRRKAIMSLDESKGREALADHLYASTDMDVDTVKAALSAAPTSAAKANPVAEYEATRANGAGLGGEHSEKASVGNLLVAKMQTKFGKGA